MTSAVYCRATRDIWGLIMVFYNGHGHPRWGYMEENPNLRGQNFDPCQSQVALWGSFGGWGPGAKYSKRPPNGDKNKKRSLQKSQKTPKWPPFPRDHRSFFYLILKSVFWHWNPLILFWPNWGRGFWGAKLNIGSANFLQRTLSKLYNIHVTIGNVYKY